MNRFDRLNDAIRNTESSIVNLLSVLAPWLAPVTPAYMTYQHALGVLHFPVAIAFFAAILVEILGFSAVSTFLAFWFHNKKDKASYKRAPIEVIVIAFIFYLTLILFSNVLLDAYPSERWAEITVRALFTLQTIPAALIIAVRTQHRDLLTEIRKEKLQKVSETSEPEQKVTENFPKDWRTLRPRLTEGEVKNIASLSAAGVKEFSRKYNVDERTVTNWRLYANREIQQHG